MSLATLFSRYRNELIEFILAFLTLIVAFSYPNIMNFQSVLWIVGVAFVVHELCHRFAATSMGLLARFRVWGYGLLITIVSVLLTAGNFTLAAPGTVYIYTSPSKRERGLIALAGPFGNLALALTFASLRPLSAIMGTAANVNFQLALINMLPFSILDGRHIMNWNSRIWGGIMVATVFSLALCMYAR
jgi:Zn-dependent protease